ncbi:lysosomal acid glucosylceramidase-like [Arctopsyche grandis]|uniref:lysosomal acid glucosylceramidase-like n=1 Tax=Arctopsyche grandis TaxID=121162 RepID=UPI00406D7017
MQKKILLFSFICLSSLISLAVGDKSCVPRMYNHSSVVCVCNSTYCDEISQLNALNRGQYVLYSSSMLGMRFEKHGGLFNKKQYTHKKKNTFWDWFKFNIRGLGDSTLRIHRDKTFQTIEGFGGAFTDATGINILSLSKQAQKRVIDSYFSKNGLEYNMGRVPIGGCDFSTHPYAYNMQPEHDVYLSNFSLTMEDFNYKIPLIREAMNVATNSIHLLGAAWSPPIWMKSNNRIGGPSSLIHKYYQTWADYHLKFLQEYKKNDVNFWAISTGNEPTTGLVPVNTFNSLGWIPSRQAKWLVNNLGPTIRNSEFSDVLILALDDQRFNLPWWLNIMAESNATKYFDGIAVHWYWDDLTPISVIENTKQLFPGKFIISTEACVGDKPWQKEKVELGSWSRAEKYIKDILENLNHWHTGWVDWNLALDKRGGPNWFDNFVDSPVIVMPENDEFLKQPMFYAIGHFSKFIPRNSKRIFVERITGDIDNVAFLRPDGGISVVFYNPFDSDTKVSIVEDHRGYIEIEVPARSIHTLTYW